MHIELEVKVLEINITKLTAKLAEIGAVKKNETLLQRRYVYDFNPPKQGSWIRLRDTWNKVTLAIKEISTDKIDWTKELETAVWEFETTNSILHKLWYEPRSYQENKRTSYKWKDVDIEIDEWPQIPPYMEIEWPNIESIEDALGALWYNFDQTTSENTTKIYQKYWIDLESIKSLLFD